jgi:hypothetical protein
MKNKYPGKCHLCGGYVPANQGSLDRNADDTGWVVQHASCTKPRYAPKKLTQRQIKAAIDFQGIPIPY